MQGLEGSPLEAQLLHGDGIRLEEVPGLAEAPVLVTGLGIPFVPVPCPHVPYLACSMHNSDWHSCCDDSIGPQRALASSLQTAQHRDDMSQKGGFTPGALGYTKWQRTSKYHPVVASIAVLCSDAHISLPCMCHAFQGGLLS